MNAPTLSAGREFWHQRSRTPEDADATFLEAARQGHYGPHVADIAAELSTVADEYGDNAPDPVSLADQLIERANATDHEED